MDLTRFRRHLTLSFAICESAALSSVIFVPPFSLSPFRDAGSQRLYILCREPVLLQALPRSWTTAAVALIVSPRSASRRPPRIAPFGRSHMYAVSAA